MGAELPRCGVCRVAIAPGENVVFRPDGRVQHVACPEVICPVCAAPIRPGEPIRRDGETPLHGNCWMRRARVAAKVMAGGADVAAVIRARLAAGNLPRLHATKVWGGNGNGAACTACGEAIGDGVEYEAEFGGLLIVRFHRVCYELWDAERMKVPRVISGASDVRDDVCVKCGEPFTPDNPRDPGAHDGLSRTGSAVGLDGLVHDDKVRCEAARRWKDDQAAPATRPRLRARCQGHGRRH
jgi:hypothetical protein